MTIPQMVWGTEVLIIKGKGKHREFIQWNLQATQRWQLSNQPKFHYLMVGAGLQKFEFQQKSLMMAEAIS